jgi:hypothetical protein
MVSNGLTVRRCLTVGFDEDWSPRSTQARMRRRFAFGCKMMRVRLREFEPDGAVLEVNGQLQGTEPDILRLFFSFSLLSFRHFLFLPLHHADRQS